MIGIAAGALRIDPAHDQRVDLPHVDFPDRVGGRRELAHIVERVLVPDGLHVVSDRVRVFPSMALDE